MFKKPTVFVLGAGASWHYGYPTGEELVREVGRKCDVLEQYFASAMEEPVGRMPQYVQEKLTSIRQEKSLSPANEQYRAWSDAISECAQLKQRLRNVDPLVIDYFLGQNIELQPLGKMLIAWVIRERETRYQRESRNMNRKIIFEDTPPEDNWIRYVVHRLVVGCASSKELLQNQVTFVTFNYDMSLEDQIRNGLRSNSLFSVKDVNEFLGGNRFLHVYGKIRDNLNTDFVPLYDLHAPGAKPTAKIDPDFAKGILDQLYRISRDIRTIDPHEKSDETQLEKIRNIIYRAQCIYVLGFGFDRKNCERIGLDPVNLRPSIGMPKSILFTNHENSNRVNKAASKAFTSHADAFLGEKLTNDSRGGLGNYHEKSTRDCYGALALDFDEIEEY